MITDRPRAGCFLEGAPPLRTKSTLVLATGFAALALAVTGTIDAARAQATTDSAATPSTTTPMHAHHKSMHHKPTYPRGKNGHLLPTVKGDAAVEDLNNQSLSAAKSGTAFTPTPSSTKAEAGMSNSATPHGMMHHHHGMGMKHSKMPADSSSMPSTSTPATPPADTSTTPPASTTPGAPAPQ